MRYCDWPGCTDAVDVYLGHIETGAERAYCEEHAPDTDGETWEVIHVDR